MNFKEFLGISGTRTEFQEFLKKNVFQEFLGFDLNDVVASNADY
jgi:hypothetical protein